MNGWKPFAVMSRQRFKSSTLRHFYALSSAVTAISCSRLKSFLLLNMIMILVVTFIRVGDRMARPFVLIRSLKDIEVCILLKCSVKWIIN